MMTWLLALVVHGQVERAELMPDQMVCEAARSVIVREIPKRQHKRWQCLEVKL